MIISKPILRFELVVLFLYLETRSPKTTGWVVDFSVTVHNGFLSKLFMKPLFYAKRISEIKNYDLMMILQKLVKDS